MRLGSGGVRASRRARSSHLLLRARSASGSPGAGPWTHAGWRASRAAGAAGTARSATSDVTVRAGALPPGAVHVPFSFTCHTDGNPAVMSSDDWSPLFLCVALTFSRATPMSVVRSAWTIDPAVIDQSVSFVLSQIVLSRLNWT